MSCEYRRMRTRLVVAAALSLVALAVAAPAPAGAHYREIGRDCGQIGFEEQTDFVAGDIHAYRVTCRTARRLVRRWTVAGDRTPLDFRCRRRTHDPDDGLAHSDVVCKRGTRRVSWAAF